MPVPGEFQYVNGFKRKYEFELNEDNFNTEKRKKMNTTNEPIDLSYLFNTATAASSESNRAHQYNNEIIMDCEMNNEEERFANDQSLVPNGEQINTQAPSSLISPSCVNLNALNEATSKNFNEVKREIVTMNVQHDYQNTKYNSVNFPMWKYHIHDLCSYHSQFW